MGVSGIPKARNIVEWAVDATHELVIGGFEPELQDMIVTSNSTGQPIAIKVMRVYLSQFDGVSGEYEWNIASKQAMELVNGFLKRVNVAGLKLRVTRQGTPPKTRWAIAVLGEK
jgi:hypothetical protein